MYSCWSTKPAGTTFWMKWSSVSAALRASSWVGEFGEEPPPGVEVTAPVPGVVVARPATLLLLLLRRSCGDTTALSMLNGGAETSFAGDSSADDGAVDGTLYLGVDGSVDSD